MGRKTITSLQVAAQLAGWATPRANEGERGGRGDNLGLRRGYPMKHNGTLGKIELYSRRNQ